MLDSDFFIFQAFVGFPNEKMLHRDEIGRVGVVVLGAYKATSLSTAN